MNHTKVYKLFLKNHDLNILILMIYLNFIYNLINQYMK